MPPSLTLALTVLSWTSSLISCSARHWTDVDTFHELTPDDSSFSVKEVQMEFDGLFFTGVPSSSPTLFPTVTPQPTSTPRPTDRPSASPTDVPSASPSTSVPSSSPTVTPEPTATPSAAPSDDPYPYNEPPPNAPSSYFNYDPNTPYGPNRWKDYWKPPNQNYYYKEFTEDGFGTWDRAFRTRGLDDNNCNQNEQSPINVERSFNGTHFASCRGFGHQILAGYGDMELDSDDVDKRIEPNKLRLVYNRRPCLDFNNDACLFPEPAFGDFPNGWGGKADILNMDFKVPSEHWVNGIAYDAEMQIFHGHRGRTKMPTAGVVIKALPAVHNRKFQEILDLFQQVFDRHQLQCNQKRRRERRKLAQAHRLLKGKGVWDSIVDYATSWQYSLWSDEPEMSFNTTRKLKAEFFPYHPLLVPSPYFYAYSGSLTEPPCAQLVEWRIIRRPMLISTEQLEQLKTLIFNHVDSNCERTSVHFDRKAARPLQPTNKREVVRCSSLNYDFDPNIVPPNRGSDSYDESLPLI